MKPCHPIALVLIAHAAAQEPPIVVEERVVPTPPPVVVEEKVVPAKPPVVVEREVSGTYAPATHPLDPALVRRQLATPPKIIEVREKPAVVVPPTRVETETRVIEEPVIPARVYYPERNIVIVEGRELPYVTIPVLFEKETAELLDSESRVALEETAKAILEVLKTSPDAGFDVEGHTSIEGTEEFNLKLSADRARRVYDELTRRYGVPVSVIGAHGFGEKYPDHPNGTEAELALDRRVLVVRVK